MNVDIIILNGFANSGKDSFVSEFTDLFTDKTHTVGNLSCADVPKDALFELGWNGEKTQEVRTLLKDLVNFYQVTPTYQFDTYIRFYTLITDNLKRGKNRVTCFYHARQLDITKSILIDIIQDIVSNLEESYPDKLVKFRIISMFIRRLSQESNPEIDFWETESKDYDLVSLIEEGKEHIVNQAYTINDTLLNPTTLKCWQTETKPTKAVFHIGGKHEE